MAREGSEGAELPQQSQCQAITAIELSGQNFLGRTFALEGAKFCTGSRIASSNSSRSTGFEFLAVGCATLVVVARRCGFISCTARRMITPESATDWTVAAMPQCHLRNAHRTASNMRLAPHA